MRDKYQAAALTAAVTGGDVLPSLSPAIPCGVDGIVDAAVSAARAGASAVHLHARYDDGRPTGSAEVFSEIAEGIRAQSNVVLNLTTGGSPTMTEDERLEGVAKVVPDIGTLNLGTMNFEGFPTKSRWPTVSHAWEREVLEASGTVVFKNTLGMMRRFAHAMNDLGVVPELEVYDLSHLSMARFLIDEGTLLTPVRIQFVLGVLGGAGSDPADLFALQQAATRILGPTEVGSMSVAAVGYPAQLRSVAIAYAWGLDARVGLEDSLRVRRRQQAAGNADLVEAAVAIADTLERPIMTPDEFRAELTRRDPDGSGTVDPHEVQAVGS
jgi:uncharacterized protein (DUF849 family)